MTAFEWLLSGSKREFAGVVDADWPDFPEQFFDNPVALERKLLKYLCRENAKYREGAAQILYVVLGRPEDARELCIAEKATDDQIDRPPILWYRAPAVISRWESLSQKQRERELLLIYYHDAVRSPASADREARIAAICECLLDRPAD